MEKPKHHIFVCTSSRMSGEPKGVCCKKNGAQLIQTIQEELDERGMSDVIVTNTGCMKFCEKGPIMIIYPEGIWYAEVDEDKVVDIIDALENGDKVEAYEL